MDITVIATLIINKWDTEGKRVKLPKKVKIVLDVGEDDTIGEIHEQAMDKVSDKFGWCIESCNLTNVKIC